MPCVAKMSGPYLLFELLWWKSSCGNIIMETKRIVVWLFDEAVLDVALLSINMINQRLFFSESSSRLDGRDA